MPSVEPFDGTMDTDNYPDVYKAQMYVQDMDDSMCCRFFLATPERDCIEMVQRSLEWEDYFLPSASGIVQHPLRNKQQGKEDKHSHSQDSARKIGEYKGIYDEVQLRGRFNPGLTRWGSLCCFSQWIAPGEIQVFPC